MSMAHRANRNTQAAATKREKYRVDIALSNIVF